MPPVIKVPLDGKLIPLLKEFTLIGKNNRPLRGIWNSLEPVTVELNGFTLINTQSLDQLIEESEMIIQNHNIDQRTFTKWGSLLTVVHTTMLPMPDAIREHFKYQQLSNELKEMIGLVDNLDQQMKIRDDIVKSISSIDTLVLL